MAVGYSREFMYYICVCVGSNRVQIHETRNLMLGSARRRSFWKSRPIVYARSVLLVHISFNNLCARVPVTTAKLNASVVEWVGCE